MKPTLLSFYMNETGDDARVTLREETLGLAPSTISLPLPASIHAPIRRLLAAALSEMGRDLAAAVSPHDEDTLASIREAIRADGEERGFVHVREAADGIVARVTEQARAEGFPFAGRAAE